MQRALDIAKKNELYALIKAVGDYHGEEIEFLRLYAKDCVTTYANDLDAAIACFKDLKSQIMVKKEPKKLDTYWRRVESSFGELFKSS